MKFNTLQRMVESGKQPKIFYVDKGIPYLFTGQVIGAREDDGARFVTLSDYVALHVANSKNGESDSGLFGLDGEHYNDLVVHRDFGDGDEFMITTGFSSHRREALKLVRKVCGEETPSFTRYLKLSEYFGSKRAS